MEKRKAIVLLEDGTVFEGKSAGIIGTATGEICFNTGMTGYQEIFTDPSYYGQILVAATAHIGNYGVAPEDIESDSVKIAGFICKKFSETYSRPAANESLQDYFERDNIVAVCDIDTRALVRIIRDKGAMNVIISSEDKSIEELDGSEKFDTQTSATPTFQRWGLESVHSRSRGQTRNDNDPFDTKRTINTEDYLKAPGAIHFPTLGMAKWPRREELTGDRPPRYPSQLN